MLRQGVETAQDDAHLLRSRIVAVEGSTVPERAIGCVRLPSGLYKQSSGYTDPSFPFFRSFVLHSFADDFYLHAPSTYALLQQYRVEASTSPAQWQENIRLFCFSAAHRHCCPRRLLRHWCSGSAFEIFRNCLRIPPFALCPNFEGDLIVV